jgi:hypothetical protein
MELLTKIAKPSKKLSCEDLQAFFVAGVFSDCTVVAQGQKIECHRIILSSASPYFKEILTFNHENNKHPIIVFEKLSKDNLLYLLTYIYSGEVELPNSQVQSFMETLEFFGIDGPTQLLSPIIAPSSSKFATRSKSVCEPPNNVAVGRKAAKRLNSEVTESSSKFIKTEAPKKNRQLSVQFKLESPGEEDLQSIGRMTMNSLNTAGTGLSLNFNKNNVPADKENVEFACKFCGKSLGSRRSCLGHEKSCKNNPDRVSYTCEECGTQFSRHDSLKNHEKRIHMK